MDRRRLWQRRAHGVLLQSKLLGGTEDPFPPEFVGDLLMRNGSARLLPPRRFGSHAWYHTLTDRLAVDCRHGDLGLSLAKGGTAKGVAPLMDVCDHTPDGK